MSDSICIRCGEFVLNDLSVNSIDNNHADEFQASSSTRFNVPLYQRLYSWERSQVRQLLDDLSAAYGRNPNQDYYVGNLVLAPVEGHLYDLIDGQQRVTTLWLILLVLAKRADVSEDSRNLFRTLLFVFHDDKQKPRLEFQIRDAENNYLKTLLEFKELDGQPQPLDRSDQSVNKRLIDSIRVAEEFFSDYALQSKGTDNSVQKLGCYILKHARLVATVLPREMDLNSYFEVMNNRGVQLEKHEILKALILHPLDQNKEELTALARIWDACSQMDVYLEEAFGRKNDADKKVGDILQRSRLAINDNGAIKQAFAENLFDELVNKLGQTDSQGDYIELCNLEPRSDRRIAKSKGQEQEEGERYRSILRFPVFLCHVLSLYVVDDGKGKQKRFFGEKSSFQDTQLLVTYADLRESLTTPEKVRKFICHLFACRLLFDHYVIKYRNIDGRSRHDIWRLKSESSSEDKTIWSRASDPELRQLGMLQAMLSVSMQDQFWLPPFLAHLLYASDDALAFKNLLQWLERLEVQLAQLFLQNQDRDKFADYMVANPKDEEPTPWGISDDSITKDTLCKVLNQGTATPRYWFFRLDYLLWKKRESCDALKEMLSKDQWAFQFRQNRSVEHIFPQHPANVADYWGKVDLDKFGNLALISVESNSAFNCQLPKDKRLDFLKRRNMIESLKLALIYGDKNAQDGNWTWGTEQAESHAKFCIDLLWESLDSSTDVKTHEPTPVFASR